MRRPKRQAIDDVTGFKVDADQLKKQWDGFLTVDPDRRNMQDCIKPRPPCPPSPCTRPEQPDRFIAVPILQEDYSFIFAEDGSGELLMTEGVIVEASDL